MSYLDYPRVHFSGGFKASPSTINNAPNNYNPLVYPSPNELEKVELYWNPKGDGGFGFVNCVVSRIDYADGTSATTSAEDSLIGQPVTSIGNPSFPIDSAMVDLDPMQQNTSEIYALRIQIGGTDANLSGSFANAPFNAIWQQAQGANAPHSSASGSAMFQAKLDPVAVNGNAGSSKFLQYFQQNPGQSLSVNFVTYAHNNAPHIYAFTSATFSEMLAAGVPQSTLDKLAPMKNMVQNFKRNPTDPDPRGLIPTKDFVTYIMGQYLTTEEFNQCIDIVLAKSTTSYIGSTEQDFLFGLMTGTAGASTASDPTFFVNSRMMCPPNPSQAVAYFAPFSIDANNVISINLGNSLPTNLPGSTPYASKLGTLQLVSFPGGKVTASNAQVIATIPVSESMITDQAGFFRYQLSEAYASTPLGIISSELGVLLSENPQGYYMRADQFVFRMNPGFPTTPTYDRGDTNKVHIYVNKFGKPVPDGLQVTMTMLNESEAETYTAGTIGTSGTLGIKNVSIPQTAISMAGSSQNSSGNWQATVTTVNSVATFDLSCVDPGNPRGYVDGQVYFFNYGFADPTIQGTFKQDVNDLVSVLVYNQHSDMEAPDVLRKFGMLYKIMSFLTDEQKVEQIDLRNMIKLLLQRPFDQVQHMPATRDMSDAQRKEIVAWIDALNNS